MKGFRVGFSEGFREGMANYPSPFTLHLQTRGLRLLVVTSCREFDHHHSLGNARGDA